MKPKSRLAALLLSGVVLFSGLPVGVSAAEEPAQAVEDLSGQVELAQPDGPAVPNTPAAPDVPDTPAEPDTPEPEAGGSLPGLPQDTTSPPAVDVLAVTSGEGWSFDEDTRKLTITSNAGTTGWRDAVDKKTVKTVEIQEGVTEIGKNAFQDCINITQVELPSSLISIGNYAFYNCDSLIQVELPNSLTSIGNYAFQDCDSLTQVELPNSLTSIGKYAFESCDSLIQVELPSSITSIGEYAFASCYSLAQIELPDSITSIENSMFERCASLAQIELPDSITSIGHSAFAGCDSLARIELPSGLTSIEDHTFESCDILAQIELPSGLTSIGRYAFLNCISLAQIELPSGLASIEGSAFGRCTSLTQIELPSSLQSIEYGAFEGCDNLTSVTFLSQNAPSLGGSAFPSGTTIFYPEGGIGYEGGEWDAYRDKMAPMADLTALEILVDDENFTDQLTFSPHQEEYGLSLPFDSKEAVITPTGNKSAKSIVVDGQTVASGASAKISLAASRSSDREITIPIQVEGDPDNYTKTYEITLQVEENKLVSIAKPADIDGVENGISKDDLILKLPKTVEIETSLQTPKSAAVNWDVENCPYDPNKTEEQTFDVKGTVTLPDGVENPDGISLEVTIQVTVSAKPEATVTGIEVTDEPAKTVYTAGETLDLSGLAVGVRYSDGTSEEVSFSDPAFGQLGIWAEPAHGTALEKTGTVTVTIRCGEWVDRFTVTVKPQEGGDKPGGEDKPGDKPDGGGKPGDRPDGGGKPSGSSSAREEDSSLSRQEAAGAAFWDGVKDRIRQAKAGEVVKLDLRGRDALPRSVMELLRQCPDVSLELRWDGGEEIVIPAGKALHEAGWIRYPLRYLAEVFGGQGAGQAASPPGASDSSLGGGSGAVKPNPNTGAGSLGELLALLFGI